MLPLTGRDQIRFTPRDKEGQPDAPVYLIGVPTVMGRARYRQALVEEGLRFHARGAFCAAAREWLEQIRPANLDDLRGVVDDFEAAQQQAQSGEGEIAPEILQRWSELVELLTGQSPRAARMAADNQLYLTMAPYLAAAQFLMGWEHIDLPYRREADGKVALDLLGQLPEQDIGAIWLKILDVLEPSAAQRKNSASPSSSGDSPIPSRAATKRTKKQTAPATSSANPSTSPKP